MYIAKSLNCGGVITKTNLLTKLRIESEFNRHIVDLALEHAVALQAIRSSRAKINYPQSRLIKIIHSKNPNSGFLIENLEAASKIYELKNVHNIGESNVL